MKNLAANHSTTSAGRLPWKANTQYDLGASETADQSIISLADSASNFDEHVSEDYDEVEAVDSEETDNQVNIIYCLQVYIIRIESVMGGSFLVSVRIIRSFPRTQVREFFLNFMLSVQCLIEKGGSLYPWNIFLLQLLFCHSRQNVPFLQLPKGSATPTGEKLFLTLPSTSLEQPTSGLSFYFSIHS